MKILIVDDSKLHREYMISVLSQDGHSCIVAATGQEALAKFNEEIPDLIILDVVLPDIQGHEIAKQIKQLTNTSSQNQNISWVPIIFLSGVTDENNLEKCILAGGDDYLHKPTNKIVLRAKIYAMKRLVELQKTLIEKNNEIKQKEKLESLQKFSFGVAHEIRNPLSSIVNSSQNLIRRLKPNLDANQAIAKEIGIEIKKLHEYIQERDIINFAENILASSKRVSIIIDTLLKVTENSESKHANTNIKEIINFAIDLISNTNLSFQVPFKDITTTIEYADDIPEIYCNSKELELVIYGLLCNCCHALVDIPKSPTINIASYIENQCLIITITDNGKGIPAHIMSKIFDPFFTTKSLGQGLGLGLTVAYNIISNKHNGNIFITSKENEWTTVTIKLPIELGK